MLTIFPGCFCGVETGGTGVKALLEGNFEIADTGKLQASVKRMNRAKMYFFLNINDRFFFYC